jgi:phthiocerol/phenolphthiocerol synthesis type-I polyketide synthase E
VFSTPTIRQLVARVGEAAERAASVVQLNSVRSGTPIYCLAGVKLYKELAEHQTASPVFGVYAKRELAGLQAQDAGEAVEVPLDALVQTYADAIVRHATQKKIVLAGLSFGGLLALEVAVELNRRGFEVGQVALFDSVPPGAYTRSYRKALKDVTQRLAEGRVVDTVRELVGGAYSRFADSVPDVLARLPRINSRKHESVQGQAFRQMTRSYDPNVKSYHFEVLLIKATQKTYGIGARLKHDYGFKDLVLGRLDVFEVDADHRSMLEGAAAPRVFQVFSDFVGTSGTGNGEVVPLQQQFVEQQPRAQANQ